MQQSKSAGSGRREVEMNIAHVIEALFQGWLATTDAPTPRAAFIEGYMIGSRDGCNELMEAFTAAEGHLHNHADREAR